MRFLIQLCRILVGGLFIFSGLIKANDPLGFSYKLDEYFEAFGTEYLLPFSLFISIFMCAIETLLGFMLLIGARIKLTLWLLLLMILFFASLNFYSGYYNKVRECGCFGDAIKLTPWQEFANNMVMLVMTLIMMIGKNNIRPLMGRTIENFFVLLAALASVGFPLYTYNYLPIIDFRPFAIGKNIQEGMKLPPDAKPDSILMVFIYEKDGKQIELTTEQLKTIDSTYKFIDRKDKIIREGDKPAIHDFSIVSVDGNDYTEQILNYPGYYFFLVCYDLDKTNKNVFGKINDFVRICREEKVPIIALTASSDKIDWFKKETETTLDFYLTDQTTLKTMIRSNPGLMLLKQGTVIDMWHYHSFPSYSDVKRKYLIKENRK
jgi:uncharacterized membrane protein YphA (DoxX/SURF4 family)